MNIDLVRTDAAQAGVIENLIRFYIYDLSTQMGWRCPENGLFGGQDDLPQYWGKPAPEVQYAWPEGTEGHPFTIRVEDELAGFALVRRLGDTSPPHFEIAAFFVLAKFRGKHVGTQVAQRLFGMFPGDWTVGSMVGNTPANQFWHSAIALFSRGQFRTTEGKDESGRFDMVFHHFKSNGAANKHVHGTASRRP